MAPPKSSFLDKVLGRIGRLDSQGLQTIVERLARERSFLETLFNTIEDGVLVTDEDGRILYFNQAVTNMLGWTADKADGQLITRVIPELNWDKLADFDSSGGQRAVRHEFEIQYPRHRFIRLYAAPLDGRATGSAGVALILHDATEARKEKFEAIESERTHSLTLLAASVAHEIGNPLNALHIHLQLMSREVKKLRTPRAAAVTGRRSKTTARPETECDDVAEKLEHYLDVAKGEITRLDYIITQFLQAIRPTQPQFKLVPVNDVIREIVELLGPELQNRGLTVKQKLSRQSLTCRIDPGQIKQALVNLIKNSMQAMTKNGVLTLESGESSESIWISISDTGGGIPQDQINRIFEPFYTTKKKGTGLGLMIVQRIMSEHGGRIEVESHVGRGTVFRLNLPLHERSPRLLQASSNA